MDIIRFYQEHHIPFQTEGHKHARAGWVNIECPFCSGNPGYHLGFSIAGNFFTCWRCGGKPIPLVISKLLHIPKGETGKIINQYGGRSKQRAPDPKKHIKAARHKFPSNTSDLKSSHKKYLEKRKFNPTLISHQWDIKGTGPSAILDGIDYGRRLLAPVLWCGEQVSYQARDISGTSKLKYLACPQNREIIPHQTILYGNQNQWSDIGVCVEGITDVWRMGPKSFAVFGIDYTLAQVRHMIKAFRRIVILFDEDPQAVEAAKKLKGQLEFRGTEAAIEKIKGDPGALDQSEADYLMKEFLKKIY